MGICKWSVSHSLHTSAGFPVQGPAMSVGTVVQPHKGSTTVVSGCAIYPSFVSVGPNLGPVSLLVVRDCLILLVFVSVVCLPQQVEELGVSNLVGTPLLRGYMHGFFMDMKLYTR